MKLAFDTSVLVPGLIEAHPRHARARIWLKSIAARSHEGTMSWHAVAETWSVLTRLPPPLALPGEEARIVLEKLRRVFTVVEPKGAIYESALLRCSAAGASSGAVFDAIHLVIAEEAGADVLLTFNAKDFLRLSVEKSPRILTPPDPPELAVDR